jgi:hypothetical protein
MQKKEISFTETHHTILQVPRHILQSIQTDWMFIIYMGNALDIICKILITMEAIE